MKPLSHMRFSCFFLHYIPWQKGRQGRRNSREKVLNDFGTRTGEADKYGSRWNPEKRRPFHQAETAEMRLMELFLPESDKNRPLRSARGASKI
ncbi:MAG: hypothetical protein IJJ42_01795 [Clostridia bacterium]|nr:hypothetical protein [Clostridia bacterium]